MAGHEGAGQDVVGLKNIAGTQVNPATESTLSSILTKVTGSGGIVNATYDYVEFSYPNGTTDVITFRTGGANGTVVATVTVVYTDTDKENILSVSKE